MSGRLRAGQVEGRTDRDGPLRVGAEVVARRRTGPYAVLTLAAGPVAQRTRPGQFVEVAVDAPGPLLRRPLSVARAALTGSGVGTIDLVVGAEGAGSAWLGGVAAHDVIDLIGPLGRPFPLPVRPASCMLVGGGYGAAPMHYLAEVLAAAGHRVDLIVGAATEEQLLRSMEAKRAATSLQFTTDDGSAGARGRVTDVMAAVATRGSTDVVYACGPNAMLAAVSGVAASLGLPVRVSIEERMACGVGVCFTCVVPVRGRDGVVHHRRSCIDGPVLDGARVDWDAMGLASAAGGASGAATAPAGGGVVGDGDTGDLPGAAPGGAA
ncbi:MAG: dihydroorotate dehydrogenase electron transfer subunit [Nitriliruptoraceae bacterium]